MSWLELTLLGTWVPLESGIALARTNNIYDKLRAIFEFDAGSASPPPAPKHTTAKPKQPKKPAVPKFSNAKLNKSASNNMMRLQEPLPAQYRPMEEDFDNISSQLNDDESMADDITVASASFMGEEDRYDMSQHGTGHRKRKHEDAAFAAEEAHRVNHTLYSDALLDYFMLSTEEQASKPEPPINFQADWIIEAEGHTALHWGAAMGDIGVIKEMIRHGADLAKPNVRGETPLMRAVMFTNCQDKQVMPLVVKELAPTIERTDRGRATVLHHAAMLAISRQKHHCARYYLDVLLNQICTEFDQQRAQRLIDAQDMSGDTAVHLAAKNGAKKCVRALIGRGARTDILNGERISAEKLIENMIHDTRSQNLVRSSSPFAPDYDSTMPEDTSRDLAHISEAGMSMQSRVKPTVHEKMDELAQSFDNEMKDKEAIEKNAQRVLRTTAEELHTTQEKIMDLQMSDDKQTEEHRKIQVVHLENEYTSLIEQQQSLLLRSGVQREQNKANGHGMSDDDVLERAILAQELLAAQQQRLALMQQYIEARGLAGAGEKGEQYRKLLVASVGADVDLLDIEILDSLIEQLRDEDRGRDGETIHPEDL